MFPISIIVPLNLDTSTFIFLTDHFAPDKC